MLDWELEVGVQRDEDAPRQPDFLWFISDLGESFPVDETIRAGVAVGFVDQFGQA